MVRLTIEHEGRTIKIEAPAETGEDFVQDLFRPAMLALQFHPDTVDDVLGKAN